MAGGADVHCSQGRELSARGRDRWPRHAGACRTDRSGRPEPTRKARRISQCRRDAPSRRGAANRLGPLAPGRHPDTFRTVVCGSHPRSSNDERNSTMKWPPATGDLAAQHPPHARRPRAFAKCGAPIKHFRSRRRGVSQPAIGRRPSLRPPANHRPAPQGQRPGRHLGGRRRRDARRGPAWPPSSALPRRAPHPCRRAL